MTDKILHIYILSLEQDKYYVGRTENPQTRFFQHFNDCGSKWAKKYKPICVLQIIPNCDYSDEDKYTLITMKKYGVDNVRGGSYCKETLNQELIQFLQSMLNNTVDRCFKCGATSHFVKNCPIVDKHSASRLCFGKNLNINDFENNVDQQIQSNKDKKQIKFACIGCTKTFAFKTGLAKHENICENKQFILIDKEKRTCKICGKIYSHQAGLSRHKRDCQKNIENTNNVQTDENVDQLKENDILIEVNDEKKENIQNISANDKIIGQHFECTDCDKTYTTKSALNKHKNKNRCKKNKTSEIDVSAMTTIVATVLQKLGELKIAQNLNTPNSPQNTNVSNNISHYNFAVIYFPNASLLEAIPENCLPKIDIETIINHYQDFLLTNYIGDYLTSYYKKEKSEEQSFWNVDKSRNNYIIREETQDKKQILWNDDLKGCKIKNCVIIPYLNHLCKELENYLINPELSKITLNEDFVKYQNKLETINNIKNKIKNNNFYNEILTYMSSKFNIRTIRQVLQNTN